VDVATVLSAIAATVAAALAGVNLVVLGRLEDRRWVRETATEALVAYLAASFETTTACREAVRLRATNGRPDELEEVRLRIRDAHETQMENFTRLRLVSTGDVIAAADELHEADHKVVRLSLGELDDGEDAGEDDAAMAEARTRLGLARSRMVTAARSAIRLRDPADTANFPT
jgi:hypothetical protein